jgi:cobalamin biosynthesis protein CbiD
MGDVINIGPHAITVHQDEPAHMDDCGRVLLIGAFGDLVKLRDSAADAHSRKQTDAVVKQIGIVLARYEPEGAA